MSKGQAPRPLADVLHELCRERGLEWAQVVQRVRSDAGCGYVTVYRALNGTTSNPALPIVAALCRALDVRPQDLFERTGLWSRQSESASAAALRGAWTAVACLPDAERMRITQVVRALVEAAQAQREQAAATAARR